MASERMSRYQDELLLPDYVKDRYYEDNCGNLRDMEEAMTDQQIQEFIASKEGGEFILECLINEHPDLLTIYLQNIASGDMDSANSLKNDIWDIAKQYLEETA